MDVIKEIARLEALKDRAHADGQVGMVLWYEARIEEFVERSVLIGSVRDEQLLNLPVF